MSKNYDYKLICASSASDFENQITKYLNEGYKLEGTRTVNISIAEKVFYTQAMIKEDNSDKTMLSENTQIDNILRKFCTESIIEVGVDKDD